MEYINKLKDELHADDWTASLNAAEKLADLNRPETILILIEALQSDNNFIRNAAALGIRKTHNLDAHNALWDRIRELGPNEEIGTLVYSLETVDCSRRLLDIVDFYFRGNFEVKNSTTTILNQQEFILSKDDFNKLTLKLKKEDMSVKNFKIKYKINEL